MFLDYHTLCYFRAKYIGDYTGQAIVFRLNGFSFNNNCRRNLNYSFIKYLLDSSYVPMCLGQTQCKGTLKEF